jgi:DNA-binding CsgD family transcriptional regulator
VAPAKIWRYELAKAIHEAVGSVFVGIMTCSPGCWLKSQFTTHPEALAYVLETVDAKFLPRIEQAGEGWAASIARHGTVYAPLEVSARPDLVSQLRQSLLDPIGVDGYIVAYLLSQTQAVLGLIVVATPTRSATALQRIREPLSEVAACASHTIETALALVEGCGLLALDGQGRLAALTTREKQVAYLASEGLSNLNIASRLGISEETISVHLRRVYAKLGFHSRVELAVHLGQSEVATPTRLRPST